MPYVPSRFQLDDCDPLPALGKKVVIAKDEPPKPERPKHNLTNMTDQDKRKWPAFKFDCMGFAYTEEPSTAAAAATPRAIGSVPALAAPYGAAADEHVAERVLGVVAAQLKEALHTPSELRAALSAQFGSVSVEQAAYQFADEASETFVDNVKIQNFSGADATVAREKPKVTINIKVPTQALTSLREDIDRALAQQSSSRRALGASLNNISVGYREAPIHDFIKWYSAPGTMPSDYREVTFDDCKGATMLFIAESQRADCKDIVRAILSTFGVKKLNELSESDWRDYIERIQLQRAAAL